MAVREVTIEKEFFRQVMGQFATGVTIVTTATEAGLSGLTVNSFTSVSLDPPLVLVCIALTSHTLPFLRASGHFAVNFLTVEQEALARCFATTSAERSDRFCHAPSHIAATGSPVLDGALAFVDARIIAEYPGGDHVIFLGLVLTMGMDDEGYSQSRARNTADPDDAQDKSPLAFYRSRYCQLDRVEHAPHV